MLSDLVLLAGNWVCAIQGFAGSWVDPLWSVSLEEQFYLAWPLLAKVIRPSYWTLVAALMIIVALVSRMALVSNHAGYTAVWCNTFTRLDTIACGILVARGLHGERPNLSRPLMLILAITSLSIPVLVERFTPVEAGAQPAVALLGYPAIAIACAIYLLIILSMRFDRLPVWMTAPLIYLGRISYGLYVFHVLAISLANHTGSAGFTALLLAACITVSCASISYRWLERPFLRLKARFAHVASRPIA